ncbi:MAG: amidohydrolase family protein, partial [archaeon]|nr:amidohydrolase family protein [archaeon]
MLDSISLSGHIWDGLSFEDGTITISDGMIEDVQFGISSTEDVCILPGILDMHTHVGDAGLILDKKYGLEELVAPPDGLKHRYLYLTPENIIKKRMSVYVSNLVSSGVSKFIDFREGGIHGAKLLRSVSNKAIVMGRPISKEYDSNEIDSLLKIADGIGISSISDMDARYIEAIADHVHRKNKKLAFHVSERIREDIDTVMSLSPDLIIHMTQATDSDFCRCADEDVSIAVCPSSNLYFGMIPPVSRMLNAGVCVSLGTDNGMLFPSADIFQEVRVLSEILKAQGRELTDAFSCMYACGHDVMCNNPKIKTGMKADLVVFCCGVEKVLTGQIKPIRYVP